MSFFGLSGTNCTIEMCGNSSTCIIRDELQFVPGVNSYSFTCLLRVNCAHACCRDKVREDAEPVRERDGREHDDGAERHGGRGGDHAQQQNTTGQCETYFHIKVPHQIIHSDCVAETRVGKELSSQKAELTEFLL